MTVDDANLNLKVALEPAAVDAFDAVNSVVSPDLMVKMSIAISLKRLADALQPTNQSGMNSIPETLHGIMLNGRP